jgi:hypothetical protein
VIELYATATYSEVNERINSITVPEPFAQIGSSVGMVNLNPAARVCKVVGWINLWG